MSVNDADINERLRKIGSAPNERLRSRSVMLENVAPFEEPEENWHDFAEADGPRLRAASKMGLLTEVFCRWEPTDYGEQVPDGGDYIVSLTGVGIERLMKCDEPFRQRAVRQLNENIPTIVTSVIAALVISYLLKLFGWSQ